MAISGRSSDLLLALLIAHGQQIGYVPGLSVDLLTGAYRGEGKSDAEDALVIADQARIRGDFTPIETPPELVSPAADRTPTRSGRRVGVRLINRL